MQSDSACRLAAPLPRIPAWAREAPCNRSWSWSASRAQHVTGLGDRGFPIGLVAAHRLALLDIVGSQSPVHDQRAADGGIPIQADSIEANHQSVARHRAFDVEGSCQWITTGSPAHTLGVCSSRIHRPGLDGVARIEAQDRLYAVKEEMLKLRGLECTSGGGGVLG